jgi:CheY-like chemotaxis protein
MHRTCLLAAHDPWFIQLLKIYLEECGLQVLQAFEGQEALTKALNEHPAVVLLQMDLPGLVKGGDVLAQLRVNPATCQIPVLVFSWQDLDEEVIEGAAAQLIEPVTYDVFVEALRAAGVDVSEAGNARHPFTNSIARRSTSSDRQ